MTRCICILTLLISPWAAAQECTRSMVVDVFDEKTSKGVDHLTAQDFLASINGVPLPVVSTTQEFNLRVLVLVETSGASDYPDVSKTIHLMEEQARRAPAGRALAFGVFSQRSAFTKGFIGDPKARNSAIDEVMALSNSLGQKVALFDALHDALALFGRHQPGDTILLLSDGYDNASARNSDDLEKEMIASGIRLLTVVRQRSRIVPRDFRGRARAETFDLKFMTSRTGGSYLQAYAPRALEFAWAGYMVNVQPPAGLTKPKPWKLEVRDESGRPSKRHFLFYPDLLAPCPAPALH